MRKKGDPRPRVLNMYRDSYSAHDYEVNNEKAEACIRHAENVLNSGDMGN